MNNMSKSFKGNDGSERTVVINSNDSYNLKLDKNYKLANHNSKQQSKLIMRFKGTILGSEIGVKSGGFSSVAILATVIAVATIFVLYLVWRF